MSKYPELDKLVSVRDEAHKLGEFLEWLNRKYYICDFDEGEENFYDVHKSIEQFLADYFEIDLTKAEIERQQILKELQDGN